MEKHWTALSQSGTFLVRETGELGLFFERKRGMFFVQKWGGRASVTDSAAQTTLAGGKKEGGRARAVVPVPLLREG